MSQGGANSSSGSGASPVETLTGNSGGAVSPTAFNIDILGNNSTGIDIVGTPASSLLTVIGLAASTTQVGTVELATAVESGTLTDSTRAVTPASLEPILVTPYVVAPGGAYTTIQSALDAANAAGGGTVWVRPGTYTEDLTLYDNIDIFGDAAVSQNQGNSVSIIGTHIPPATGHIGFNSIYFQDTTAIFSSAAVGTTHIVLLNCESAVQSGYFFDLVNWTGILEIWDHNPSASGAPFAVDDGGINNTGGATLFMFAAGFGSAVVNTMNLSGLTIIGEADISAPVNFQTGSNIAVDVAQFSQSVTFSNNSTGSLNMCRFTGGANPSITMSSSATINISTSIVDSSNNPAIAGAGAGALNLVDISYLDNYLVAGTLTLGTTGFTESPLGYNSQSLYVGSRVPSNPYDISIDKSVSGLIGQSIQNTSNNAAAGANLQVIVETAAADAFTYYGVTSTTDWAVGIDNSDSDAFKITTGTTPSAGTTAISITTAGIVTLPGGPLDVPSGGTGLATITDHAVLIGSGTGAITPVGPVASTGALLASNGAGSDPGFTTATYPLTTTANGVLYSSATNTIGETTPVIDGVMISDHAAGVPSFLANGTAGYVLTAQSGAPPAWAASSGGVSGPGSSTDRAIATWNGVGGTDLFDNSTITISSAGEMVNTAQPAFLALLASTVTDVTGDGTNYTVIFDTETFDQNSDFNLGTSTFSAPVTGRYRFDLLIQVLGGTSITLGELFLNTSNNTYNYRLPRPDTDATRVTGAYSLLVDMDATDTATMSIQTTDTGGKIDDVGGTLAGAYRTAFSGSLNC